MRSEQDIFDELAGLCTSPGYVHAIAYFCYRDDLVRFVGEMTAKDMMPMFSPDRLIRTEICTLIGLMIKEEIDYTFPGLDVLQQYMDRTEQLLQEMHEAIGAEIFAVVNPEGAKHDFNPFTQGKTLREPIFYSGEAAYSFQYRDLAPRKYSEDNKWLKSTKGFAIEDAKTVADALGRLQAKRIIDTVASFEKQHPDEWVILPGFTFTLEEVAAASGLGGELVDRILCAFSLPDNERNQGFRNLQDFNVTYAAPLLRTSDGSFVLFARYSLAEALYDSPYYWMAQDRTYRDIAMANRGRFCEAFSTECLERVFRKDGVYRNVDIYESKGKRVGEIDVLVLLGNRAIVLQAKSKRLTLEARRGNDRQIKEDFKGAVQDSYDQALGCARLIGSGKCRFVAADGREITVPETPREVFILCIVSDSYPALNFQAQQFLKFEKTEIIKPPIITDVFNLDAMTEMLESPLYFFSYLNRRAEYSDRLFARDEMTILSYHLKRNLWLDDEFSHVMMDDDLAADLDVAMAVRRDGVPGKRTPDGILTRIPGTAVGRILKHIESRPDPATIELGFMLLRLSENAVLRTSEGIEHVLSQARLDGCNHDVTMGMDEGGTGLTVHCNDDPFFVASRRLAGHCTARKYAQKAASWFGICLLPADGSIRFGMNLDYEWQHDDALEVVARRLAKRAGSRDYARRSRKVGRNDLCPCGSGSKYKKCCGK